MLEQTVVSSLPRATSNKFARSYTLHQSVAGDEANPLLTSRFLKWNCPHPVPISGSIYSHPCRCPSCPECGKHQAKMRLMKFQKRLGSERSTGRWGGANPTRRYYFVTLRLIADNASCLGPDPRLWASESLKVMQGAGRVISDVRQALRQSGWSGALEFVIVTHFKPVSTGDIVLPQGSRLAYVAHIHILLCEHAGEDGRFLPRKKLQAALERYWNAWACRKLNIPRSMSRSQRVGLVYCMPCQNETTALAYMLWEHGRPWKRGHWLIPRQAQRVTSSKGFFSPSNPSFVSAPDSPVGEDSLEERLTQEPQVVQQAPHPPAVDASHLAPWATLLMQHSLSLNSMTMTGNPYLNTGTIRMHSTDGSLSAMVSTDKKAYPCSR